MVEISTLYNHFKTLAKQWFYDKDEIDTALNGKADTTDIPDVSDVIRTSNTTGLVKNDGTIDTNTYLTEHQNLSDYVEKSSTAGLIKNDGTIDTTQYLSTADASTDYIQKSQTAGLVKNDGSIDTNTYLTQHQDISGKANTADLHTVATSGSYTDLENIPATFAPSSHEHFTSEVKDATAYSNLGTSANATQSAINYAIDNKIGALLDVDLIQLESTLPTASASTMNKLYMIPESDAETNDAYEIYVTVEDNGSYDWEKVDTARIDLTNYVTTDDSRLSDARTPTSHTHGDITNDGKIGSTAGKILITGTAGAITTSDLVTEMDGVVNQLITYGASL